MARRLTLEGCDVKLVCEVMPYSAGLNRNMTQCLENFHIPLKLSATVTEIHGQERVEGVTIAAVDAARRPVPGTEEFIECDTLLLSVGLIPETEVTSGTGIHMDPVTKGPSVNQRMETSVPGIFACGNTVHVHDLVDFVTNSSLLAGACAAEYAAAYAAGAGQPDTGVQACSSTVSIPVRPGDRVRYTVPQQIDIDGAFKARIESAKAAPAGETGVPDVQIMFRSTDVYRSVTLAVYSGSTKIYAKKARIVRPGEMQTADIPAAALAGVAAPLTVSIETPEDTID